MTFFSKLHKNGSFSKFSSEELPNSRYLEESFVLWLGQIPIGKTRWISIDEEVEWAHTRPVNFELAYLITRSYYYASEKLEILRFLRKNEEVWVSIPYISQV